MNVEKAKLLKEQILKEFGYMGLYYRADSDNPILFTVQVYTLFKKLGIFDDADRKRLHAAIRMLYRSEQGGLDNKFVLGLFNRRPGADERKEQWDNYDAIADTIMFGEDFQRYSKEILDYGRRFMWYSYDNRKPYYFSANSFWKPFPNFNIFECCRQGWQILGYKACAGEWLSPFYYAWYAGKVAVEGNDPQETSGKLTDFLRYEAIGNKWYMLPFKKHFEKKIKRIYGERGIVEAFKIYHGEDSTIYKLAECLL